MDMIVNKPIEIGLFNFRILNHSFLQSAASFVLFLPRNHSKSGLSSPLGNHKQFMSLSQSKSIVANNRTQFNANFSTLMFFHNTWFFLFIATTISQKAHVRMKFSTNYYETLCQNVFEKKAT